MGCISQITSDVECGMQEGRKERKKGRREEGMKVKEREREERNGVETRGEVEAKTKIGGGGEC